jgi:hypothetical protein
MNAWPVPGSEAAGTRCRLRRLVCYYPLSHHLSSMLGQNILVWNVRGLNMRARRAVVHEFLLQERVSLLCLLETKIDVLPSAMASELMGNLC